MTKTIHKTEESYDAIIIGSGAAGMYAALALAPKKVLLITKTKTLPSGSTFYAQGGIAAALSPQDSSKRHARDTIFAGAGLVDIEAARLLTEKGHCAISDLEKLNMPFDRDEDGTLSLGKEAAHTHNRILHSGGDATGRNISQTLANAVLTSSHIHVLYEAMAEHIITDETGVTALRFYYQDHFKTISAPHIILATGGSGQLFAHTTNPTTATADGLALAYEAGAILADLEFIQFHPTSLAVETYGEPKPLLTEALRGAGAYLIDKNGKRFMLDEHKDAELAPRDIVARAVYQQITTGKGAYLDARHLKVETLKNKFPTVFALCQERGLNPALHPLPVAPAAHYHMGGVKTDLHGATNINGLWAIGEVARTGVHGANRLASNSLLECLVFAQQTTQAIKQQNRIHSKINQTEDLKPKPQKRYFPTKEMLQRLVYQGLGLVRNETGLTKTLGEITRLHHLYKQGIHDAVSVQDHIELRNMLKISQLIATQAIKRQESRGGHYRSDFPRKDPIYKTTFTCQKTLPIKTGADHDTAKRTYL